MWSTLSINQTLITKKIEEIYSVLEKIDIGTTKRVSLMDGAAGVLLFYAYHSKSFNNSESREKCYELVDGIVNNISMDQPIFPGFASGLAGIGWALDHLEQNTLLDIDPSEILEELDKVLLTVAIDELNKSNFDFLHGANGIALYLVGRKHSNFRDEYLKTLILKFKETLPLKFSLTLDQQDTAINIGLSHGISSVIPILTRIHKQNILPSLAEELIRDGVNFLNRTILDVNKASSYFPYQYSNQDNKKGTRLAWCYGDLGLCCALWQANRILGDKQLSEKILQVLLHNSKRRGTQETGIIDGGLCHGASGAAHIFGRMFHETGFEAFKDASLYWYDECLQMASFSDGYAGFKAFLPKEVYKDMWYNNFGFLEGISGIGLALMSSISEIDPRWDEALLIS